MLKVPKIKKYKLLFLINLSIKVKKFYQKMIKNKFSFLTVVVIKFLNIHNMVISKNSFIKTHMLYRGNESF